jgi:hypothetical protein
MTGRLSLEKKKRIIEEMLLGASQEQVARHFSVSTGEVSNIWTSFREGNLIDKEAGVLSEEIKDMARMARENKVTIEEFSNNFLIGKMIADIGIERGVISQVAHILKGMGDGERREVLRNLKELSAAKRQGESLQDAEKRMLGTVERAKEAEEDAERLKQEIKDLEIERRKKKEGNEEEIAQLVTRKNELGYEIELGTSISNITGLVDVGNIVGIIKAARDISNKDDFNTIAEIARKMRKNGITPDQLIRSSKILEDAEKRGFSLRLIEGVNEECKRRKIPFEEFLGEMVSMLRDKKMYEQDIVEKRKEAGELGNRLTQTREELASSEKNMGEISLSIKQAEDILASRRSEINLIEKNINDKNMRLSQLENLVSARETALKNKFREEDFVARGIKEVKGLEENIREKKGEIDKLNGEIAKLKEEISSKTNEISMAKGFLELIKYGYENDRAMLKYYAEQMLGELNRNVSKLVTEDVREQALQLLLNLGKKEIPVIYDRSSGFMKFIDPAEYKKMIDTENELRKALRSKEEELSGLMNDNRELKKKIESFGSDVRDFVISQLSSDKPDQMVFNPIQTAAFRYLEKENENGKIDRVVDSISPMLKNMAKAIAGRRDFDEPLYIRIMKRGENDVRKERVLMSDALKAIAKGKNILIQGFEVPPCLVLAGYLSGGLILEGGRFYLPRDFVKIGKMVGGPATLGARRT